MYKVKRNVIICLVAVILIVTCTVFAALLFIETRPNSDFTPFNLDRQLLPKYRVISIILMALDFSFFIFWVLSMTLFGLSNSHNVRTGKLIETLKEKFAKSKNIPIEQVDTALVELCDEIKYCKKKGIPFQRKQSQQQAQPVVVNNYSVYNSNPMSRSANAMRGGMMPPPPPPHVGAGPKPPMGPPRPPMGAPSFMPPPSGSMPYKQN